MSKSLLGGVGNALKRGTSLDGKVAAEKDEEGGAVELQTSPGKSGASSSGGTPAFERSAMVQPIEEYESSFQMILLSKIDELHNTVTTVQSDMVELKKDVR